MEAAFRYLAEEIRLLHYNYTHFAFMMTGWPRLKSCNVLCVMGDRMCGFPGFCLQTEG